MELAAQIIGWIAFVTSSIMLLPQVIKVVKTGSTKGISFTMFSIALINYALWTAFGLMTSQPQVYICNILAFSASGIICFYMIANYFKRKSIKKKSREQESKNEG